jgi:hypothetical protein
MHRRSLVWLLVIVFVGTASASTPARASQASTGDEYLGKWTGTWDGSGSGEFELTLEKGKDAPAGKVAVTTEQGNYTADLKSLSFSGKSMSATYDFPLDPSAEVAIAATFDGGKAKGTWSLRPKGQATELAGGSWTVARK